MTMSFINVLICSLPDELLLKILDYLTPVDLLSSARVCKRWLSLTNDKLVIYRFLQFLHIVFILHTREPPY